MNGVSYRTHTLDKTDKNSVAYHAKYNNSVLILRPIERIYDLEIHMGTVIYLSIILHVLLFESLENDRLKKT